jgi:hypothetical protein
MKKHISTGNTLDKPFVSDDQELVDMARNWRLFKKLADKNETQTPLHEVISFAKLKEIEDPTPLR